MSCIIHIIMCFWHYVFVHYKCIQCHIYTYVKLCYIWFADLDTIATYAPITLRCSILLYSKQESNWVEGHKQPCCSTMYLYIPASNVHHEWSKKELLPSGSMWLEWVLSWCEAGEARLLPSEISDTPLHEAYTIMPAVTHWSSKQPVNCQIQLHVHEELMSRNFFGRLISSWSHTVTCTWIYTQFSMWPAGSSRFVCSRECFEL